MTIRVWGMKEPTLIKNIEWFSIKCGNTKIKPITYLDQTAQPISNGSQTKTKTKVIV